MVNMATKGVPAQLPQRQDLTATVVAVEAPVESTMQVVMSVEGDRLLQEKFSMCRLLGSRLVPWLQRLYKYQVISPPPKAPPL
ncbi:hypothetical protein ERO13_A07G032150v2 [Gossypium hirsutum]|uniref:Uncharacterized protein n=1 Tax=Gossypium darwinii TaxID=34276 RepID=A0A5D2FRX1_GOSDA|nr:hypothetical protein ERO13_A07G032150v2 [Gossypium hirsutum]TYH08714.1 hypothetical protein ES288_A07G038300v1 [Gossypium darwinii]